MAVHLYPFIRNMDQRQSVFVFENNDQISAFLIDQWREISGEAIRTRGVFSVALSGGETPISFYQRLAEDSQAFPWNKIHLFLADERFVPHDHPDSNYRMLRQTLLNKIDIPHENVHPVPVETLDLRSSAEKYEGELTRFFKLSPGQIPRFDFILLGIGEDGHTASLFPGSPAFTEERHLAAPVVLDQVRHHRVTLTLPVINQAENVLFLVTGENKARAMRKIIDSKDLSLPASRVRPGPGNLFFVLDREASSQLTRQGYGTS
ncbi:MAG: 6-phosphogluconolactonase [Deltaproteobacteria bacterium]